MFIDFDWGLMLSVMWLAGWVGLWFLVRTIILIDRSAREAEKHKWTVQMMELDLKRMLRRENPVHTVAPRQFDEADFPNPEQEQS
jgi:hypothetical protein